MLRCAAIPTAEVSLTASTTKTVLSILSPASRRFDLLRWSISFNQTGVVCLVKLKRIASDGTFSTGTPVHMDAGAETIAGVMRYNYTVEPSAGGDIIDAIDTGVPYDNLFAFDQYPEMAASTLIGIQIVVPSGATSLTCMPKLFWRE